MTEPQSQLLDITGNIVSAYVSNNSMASTDVARFIRDVYGSLESAGNKSGPIETSSEPQKPAVRIKNSVTPDYIVCLEDGRKLKSLRRHLSAKYKLTPDQYRAKWGLPDDYPMVAPNYAAERSKVAKQIGLGQMRAKMREQSTAGEAAAGRRRRASGQ